ncbi:hypothetical protein E2C01_081050 [Portunus trituberculatus]|uniref:Uncharacterized protein n=1 Tax=Portunus trituberculatus TaxID=210409 RepID=A0A5B7IVK9_PORTR|nr:hypothetical protein [Portunus trituberculatus]
MQNLAKKTKFLYRVVQVDLTDGSQKADSSIKTRGADGVLCHAVHL